MIIFYKNNEAKAKNITSSDRRERIVRGKDDDEKTPTKKTCRSTISDPCLASWYIFGVLCLFIELIISNVAI